MRLVVGLGNPGDRYRRTRHNVGFMAVDVLLARSPRARGRELGEAWVADVYLGGELVLLVKPATFMNRSGFAVEQIMATTGAGPRDLLVVLDEVALPLGTIRLRERGSHGGHNGLRSLIDVLGTEEIARLRVGIGRGDPPADLAEYVLSEFPAEDVLLVQEAVGQAADAVECLIHEGPAVAMSRFNATPRE